MQNQILKLKMRRDKTNTLHARVEEWKRFITMTCAVSTYSRYRSVVAGFERYVANKSIREIGPPAVMGHLMALSKSGTSMANIAMHRKILSLFFAWCVRMGYMDSNPAAAIPDSFRRAPKEKPKAITEGEYESLRLAAIGTETYYVIVCAWHTGMRMSDVCQLRWSEVDLESQTITRCLIKTRRSGTVVTIPIHPQLLELLVARYETRNPQEAHVSETAASLYVNNPIVLYDQLHAAAEKVGVKIKGFHTFRHSAIRRWLGNPAADLVTVMSMSGHKDVKSLEIYSEPSMEKKKLIMGIPVQG